MVICCKFKKEFLQCLTLYTSFHELINVYSWRSGADNPLKSDFIHFFFFFFFFMILYMYIVPLGTKFWCQQEHLVTSVICCKLQKKSLWSLILYNFLHDLIHVYSPGAGIELAKGTEFWYQQEGLITLSICCKFQRNLFEVWFYTFFHDLIQVYSPGAGAYSPPGDKVLMSTKTSCPFGHLLPVSNHRRQ